MRGEREGVQHTIVRITTLVISAMGFIQLTFFVLFYIVHLVDVVWYRGSMRMYLLLVMQPQTTFSIHSTRPTNTPSSEKMINSNVSKVTFALGSFPKHIAIEMWNESIGGAETEENREEQIANKSIAISLRWRFDIALMKRFYCLAISLFRSFCHKLSRQLNWVSFAIGNFAKLLQNHDFDSSTIPAISLVFIRCDE